MNSLPGCDWTGWNSQDNHLAFSLVDAYVNMRREAVRDDGAFVLVDTERMFVWVTGLVICGYFHRSLFDRPASGQQPT